MKYILIISLLSALLFNPAASIPTLAQEQDRDAQIEQLKNQIKQMEADRKREMEEFMKIMDERDREHREEIDSLKAKIRKMEEAAPGVTVEREKTEDTGLTNQTGTEEKEENVTVLTEVKEKIEPVLENLDIFGNIRLRIAEVDLDRPDGEPDRYRARLRLRLGVEYVFLDRQLAAGARLSTGTKNDPRSPYVTLGDGFEDATILLDRAYIRYSPAYLPGASVIAGKFGFQFKTKAIYNELVWDQDVQPEGAALDYVIENAGPFDQIYLTWGQYIVEENDSQISWMSAPQIAARASLTDNFMISGGSGTYIYYGDGLTPGDSTKLLTSPQNRGNATVDNAEGEPVAFVSDFYIWDSYIDLIYTGFSMPVTLSGEYIYNIGARINQDSGFSTGIQLGDIKNAGDWRVYYQFQLIQQDSIFTPFSQDDFLLATNFRGHIAGIQYKILNNMDLHLWTLISRPDQVSEGESDNTNFRGRVDLTVDF